MIIKNVKSGIIKDSRGDETIEVSVNGYVASSPSGKSRGKYESKPYYKNIEWCVDFFNNWNERIEINEFNDLLKIERIVCEKIGERDVKKLGGNSLYAFESAILKALAKSEKKELWEIIDEKAGRFPVPVGNIVGGGLHSEDYFDHPDFQEFLVIPENKKFSESVEAMNEFYEKIGQEIKSEEKNDEGAWQTKFDDQEILDRINFVRNRVQKKFRTKLRIGIDVAASSFFSDKYYYYNKKGKIGKKKQKDYIVKLIKDNGLFYVEDPIYERDFEDFSKILSDSKNCLVVGDDLTATQIKRVKMAIDKKSINALVVKPNQNGSLIEVKNIFDLCRKNKIKTVMSHRSGETLDVGLADYAFGFGADYIKCGISTKWREAKLKRMIEIEKFLDKKL